LPSWRLAPGSWIRTTLD
jgi:hypothetical protein